MSAFEIKQAQEELVKKGRMILHRKPGVLARLLARSKETRDTEKLVYESVRKDLVQKPSWYVGYFANEYIMRNSVEATEAMNATDNAILTNIDFAVKYLVSIVMYEQAG